MRPRGPSKSDAEKWDAIYKELEAYHKEHGHSNVPSTLKNKLSQWVHLQRQNRQNAEVRMTAERISRLDKIDFRWAKRRKVTTKTQRRMDESWRKMYKRLKTYNEKHGHCKVPIEANAKDPDQSVLGSWVSQQRQIRDRLPQSRKDLLDGLGFLWFADNWDTMYQQLVKFSLEHGHTGVKGKSSLAVWCRRQRANMRQNKLPLGRRGRMEEIGFNIEAQSEKNERIWNTKLQRLKKYNRKHGDCFGPPKSASNNAEDAELVIWITHQRMGYKVGTIPNHRIQKLEEEVGFVWSIVERGSQTPSEKQELAWEKSYEKLREFYEVHGHFTVPPVLDNGKLNPFHSWIAVQRRHFAQGQMKEDRRLKLDAIAFIWNQGIKRRSQRKWNATFQDLTKFREERGHTFVKKNDGMELWRWTKKMIWKHRHSKLSLKRVERLESIGFWNPPPAGYQEHIESNNESEEEEEESWSSENDDIRKPTTKRCRATSTSGEGDENSGSSEKDDDRKPMAKRRRAQPTESKEEHEEEVKIRNNDGRKPTAKRRRATAADATKEYEEEVRIRDDDDRERTAKRRRATEATEEYEEETRISRGLFARYSTGTKVKKFFEGHGWFIGEIASIDEEHCCYVRYEDGDEENYLLDELDDLKNIIANVDRTHPRK
jgi:hypothetical protein